MIRSFFYSTLDQINVSLTHFLWVILGARFLLPHDQSVVLSVFFFYVLLIILSYGLNFSHAYHLKKDALTQFLKLITQFYLPILILSGFLFASALYVFNPDRNWLLAFGVFAFIVMNGLADFVRRSLFLKDKPMFAFRLGIVNTCARIFFVYFAFLFSFNLTSYLWAWSLGALPSLIYFFKTSSISFARFDFKGYRNHLKRGKFGLINQSLGWTNSYLPFYYLALVVGVKEAAIFGSIRSLVSFMNIFFEQFDTIYPRLMIDSIKQKSFTMVNRMHLGFLVIWLLFLLLFVMYGRDILNYVLGSIYESHAWILILSWVGGGFYYMSRSLSIYRRVKEEFHAEVFGNVSAFVAMLVTLYLIKVYALDGAAWVGVLPPLATFIGLISYQRLFKNRHVSSV
jgi:hypothetical protein